MRRKRRDRDGVFVRKGSYYISFIDAHGRRKQQKLKGAFTLTQARHLRTAKLQEQEKARVLGYTFAQFVPHYLRHQQARVTPKAYERTRGIVEKHLKQAFGAMQLAMIRKIDVSRYLTGRLVEVSVETARREFFVLSHMISVAVDWELISANVASGVKLPKVPAGRVRYLQPTELRAVLAS